MIAEVEAVTECPAGDRQGRRIRIRVDKEVAPEVRVCGSSACSTLRLTLL